jgi:hypothetical protein
MTSITTALIPEHAQSLPQAWKTAISIGGAIALSPIIACVAGLLVVWMLPALALVLPLMAISWAQTIRLHASPVRPALPWRPAIA